MDISLLILLIWAVIGYLMGSVPFGVLITRRAGVDLRQVGSGNIGATNVLRTGKKGAAAMTLLLDGGKGAAAVLLAHALAGDAAAQVAGLAAFLGHCYPVWLRFKGGKGVATFLGILLAIAWPVGLLCCATWLAAVALSRISSMGALVSAALAPMWMLLLGLNHLIVLGILLSGLIFWRHRENIARLRAGTEPRIGQKT